MRIVVTTPTGHIGSKLADILLDRGNEITVIVRNPAKVKSLAARGARVIAGEHSNADVLGAAVENADALFWLTPPNMASHDPLGDAIRFADEGAKVTQKHPELHVVQLSSVGAHLPNGTGPIAGLHATEERFRAVGKNVTSLRANFFMENVLNSLPTIVSDGAIYGLVPGTTKAPQIATADIAEIAANQLVLPPNGHRVVDVVGPENISFDESAKILSSTIGNSIRIVTVPGEALKQGLMKAGLSLEMTELFVEMEEALAKGLALEFRGDEKLTGRTTFQQFANEVFLPAYREAGKMARAS
jgi:uncharacterized protein YbjT (DUF2867 family)